MDIQEQINALREQASISGYHSLMASAANTMEAMLKVVEAAKKISIANSWDVHHKMIAQLRTAIFNLEQP